MESALIDHRENQFLASKLSPTGCKLRTIRQGLESSGSYGLSPHRVKEGFGMTSRLLQDKNFRSRLY